MKNNLGRFIIFKDFYWQINQIYVNSACLQCWPFVVTAPSGMLNISFWVHEYASDHSVKQYTITVNCQNWSSKLYEEKKLRHCQQQKTTWCLTTGSKGTIQRYFPLTIVVWKDVTGVVVWPCYLDRASLQQSYKCNSLGNECGCRSIQREV